MFVPKFITVHSLAEAAKAINAPHEDFPLRVPETYDMLKCHRTCNQIDLKAALKIHSYVMQELPSRGLTRRVNVIVGGDIPPSWMLVEEKIKELFPVMAGSFQELSDWYQRFQTLHPFEDGNGRVGGIVVAVLAKEEGSYWAPCQ